MSVAVRMATIWSARTGVRDERELWLTVAHYHHAVGVPAVTRAALDAYERNAHRIDLDSIQRRELVTRHDVKARLEEFCDLAGYQAIHLGMTSADVVDNMALYRLRRSLWALALRHPSEAARLELRLAARRLPWRGIKGALGTYQDQLDLMGSYDACIELDRVTARRFGFVEILDNVSQIYPRSIDLGVATDVLSVVLPLASPGPRAQLRGAYTAIAGYAGESWNEGDVSTSAVRRWALPALMSAAAEAVDSAVLG